MVTYKIRMVGKYKGSLPRGRKIGLYNVYRDGKIIEKNVPSKDLAEGFVSLEKIKDKNDKLIRNNNIKAMKSAFNTANDITKPLSVRKNAKKRYKRLKKELRV